MATSFDVRDRYTCGCPDDETLKAFVLGNLSIDAMEAVGDHLGRCTGCQMNLEELEVTSDSLVEYLKVSGGQSIEDTDFFRVMARLRAMRTGRSVSAQESQASEESSAKRGSNGAVPGQLGQYRLLERIGQGSMGTVYRAWHEKLKKDVVLKLLSPRRLDDREAIARFLREMEAVGKLDDHPNIVRARDAGEIDGHYFLVMDYVEGMDVARLLCRLGTLSVADACEIVRQAALGLEYAHIHRVVHRDVKSSNLLLTSSGQVKVLDLGLAAFRADGDEPQAGAVVGTADYMAPEQWNESEAVDIRADIYSLGCTLYKLLVGEVPFSGGRNQSYKQKMKAHLKSPLPMVSKVRPFLPPELDDVLGRMLAKWPGDRFARPAEVAEALKNLAAGADLQVLGSRGKCAEGETDRMTADVTHSERRTWSVMPAVQLGRRWVLAAVGAGIVLALVGAATVWMSKTGQAVEPLELFSPGNMLWDYDARRNLLHVQCDGYALFRCGMTEDESFAISTYVGQKEWQGGVGIFFGFQKDEVADGLISFQSVEVQKTGDGAYDLVRRFVRLEKRRENAGGLSQFNLASAPLPTPPSSFKHRLEIVIERGNVAQVLWDGTEVGGLHCTSRENPWAKATTQGSYGIFATRGASKFQGMSFRGAEPSRGRAAQASL